MLRGATQSPNSQSFQLVFLDLFICAFSYNSKEPMKIFSVQGLLGKVLRVEEESQNLLKQDPCLLDVIAAGVP